MVCLSAVEKVELPEDPHQQRVGVLQNITVSHRRTWFVFVLLFCLERKQVTAASQSQRHERRDVSRQTNYHTHTSCVCVIEHKRKQKKRTTQRSEATANNRKQEKAPNHPTPNNKLPKQQINTQNNNKTTKRIRRGPRVGEGGRRQESGGR